VISPIPPLSAADVLEPAPRLGALLERLEEVRRLLERDDLELEEQMALYREGCAVVVRAKRILEQASAEVDMLMSEAEEAAG
jgi:exodeoxyribonuclease VII small subunit